VCKIQTGPRGVVNEPRSGSCRSWFVVRGSSLVVGRSTFAAADTC
jgi:hypothetical protein